MPRRPWLRHPPATLHRRPCPTGLPRFASLALAAESLIHGLARTGLTATDCRLCGGAHTHPAATAADNEETT